MSEFPTQTRTVDPYASYNSNVVNQLTRMITRGKNCLHGIHAIDVVIDSTSTDTEIVILPGEGFKDDVILQINERKTVDMTDSTYYINHLNPFNEAGYYYICLEYTYSKSRPAPVAKIRLLKPSQTNLYDAQNSAFLLLKVVSVVFNGSTFEVDELFDFDPSNPTVTKVYSQLYAGIEAALPPFEQERDEGRLVYVADMDEMYFGLNNNWESFNAVRSNLNTTICQVGELVYIGDDELTHPALATSYDTFADCVVMAIGEHGKVRLVGEIDKVKVETGVTIAYGDRLYLSGSEAGTITNTPTFPTSQFVGISITPGNQVLECGIWFLPSRSSGGHGDGNGYSETVDFYQDLLHSSVFERLFIEPFVNNDFIDSTSSNITITGGVLTGGTGDIYQTIPIKDTSLVGRIHIAQITSKVNCVGTSSVKWYISNNGDEPLDWEEAELDKLHNFATYRIAFSSGTGLFQVGENVISSITNKMATISGINGGEILVFGDTRLGVDYVAGETITGQTSGATGVVDTIVNRQTPSYNDIRVKIEFDGIASECIVENYGVLYDQDEDIFNVMPTEIDIQANLDTLYLDVYTWPSQDNDGNANLAVPLETQIHSLEEFVDNTCCARLDQVEDDIDDIYNDLDDIHDELDALDSTAVDDLIIQVNDIDNDIDTLYKDIYQFPSRDKDGMPNRVRSIEEDLINLQNQISALPTTRFPMFITTDDTTPDVSPNPSIIRIDYTGPLTITNFDNGSIGQDLTIIFTNTNTVIQHNLNIHLSGNVSFDGDNEYVLKLVHNGTRWIEESRSIPTYV